MLEAAHVTAVARASGLPRMSIWRLGDRKTRVLVATLFVPMLLLALTIFAALIGELLGSIGRYEERLYLYWTWSDFLRGHAATTIYAPQVLLHFEHTRFFATARDLPFAYPPSMFLVIWPLALLPPAAAELVWLGASLGAIVWAYRDRGQDARWSAATAVFAAIAPSTLAALYHGQVSLLVAACLIGGWRLVARRPVLAGVLFGLATVKPQLGFLVPIALVSGGYWRAILTAALTMGLTVLASGFAFGWSTWTGLPAALAALSHFAAHIPGFDPLCPNISAALRALGAGPHVAAVGQAFTAAGAAITVWFAFRRGVTPLAVALLMTGTYLATPYAVYYDLPMLSYALLLVVADRRTGPDGFSLMELAVLIAGMALPLMLALDLLGAPWGLVVPGAVFLLILRRLAARPVTRAPA